LLLARLAKAKIREREAAKAETNSTEPKLTFETILYQYAEDPEGFCRDFLVFRDMFGKASPFQMWEAQRKAALAVVKNRRVARRSGHKVGKSMLAAALVIWWTLTRGLARGILTAPTSRQVKKALWFEIRRFWQNSPKLRELMPEPALEPETGIRWDDGRELFGFTASSADKVSGPGGPAVFVVVDEASGVPRDVWEALQGIRAGGGKVLALGNPTQTSGWFYDAFHERRDGWDLDRISSRDTPNFVENRQVIPGLADREFAEEIGSDYGTDSPAYDVRVEGNFPKQVANAVVGLQMVELARLRWDDTEEIGPLELGVDVARFGDDFSAVAARRGLKLYTPEYFENEHKIKAVVNGYNSIAVAGMVVQCMSVLQLPGQRVRIKIDVTGGFGEPVAEQLRTLREKNELGQFSQFIDIIEVNFAAESSDSEKYPVLRDELWFGVRSFCAAGGSLYPDAKLESELVAPTYAPDERGRNKVEKKKDIKKRIGRSPDRADAAVLAIYNPGTEFREIPLPVVTSRWGPGRSRGF
jgi:phage terminase large subunit